MSTIRLQSSDGEIFEVEESVAKSLTTIKIMLESGIADANDMVVPIPKVSGTILRKVLEYLNKHKDDAVISEKRRVGTQSNGISLWDYEFLNVDQSTLIDLILAANFLDAKELMSVACTAVANTINGKSAEEIRKTFNIKNDIPSEGQEQVRREEEK